MPIYHLPPVCKSSSAPREGGTPNIYALASALGLRVVRHLDKTTEDGKYWLPGDLIGDDGKTLIIYREADHTYACDGWEPWHDGMFGGRKTDFGSALNWVARARDVRAGKATDFLGC